MSVIVSRARRALCSSMRVLLVAAPVAFVASGCAQEKKAGAAPAQAPVAVSAGTAETWDVPIELHAVGRVEPRKSVAVGAQVDGQLIRVAFSEGDDVRRGDVLFEIDPRPHRAALDQVEAVLARDAAEATVAAAEARRYAELVQKDLVTLQEAEEKAAAAEAARASVEADSAAVERARLDLDYCAIRAPISGRTGSLLLHEGNLVKANDDNPMVVINEIAPAVVGFAVPDRDLPEVRRRSEAGALAVDVSPSGDSAQVFHGELTFIDNAVNEATGTILLKATIPNEDRSLWPGQFVNVALRLGTQASAVVVPSTAVQPGQQGDYVFVIGKDQAVELRPVKAGRQVDGRTVIAAGVEAGEQVVTDGQLRLVAGARVSIKPPVGSAQGTGSPAEGAPATGSPATVR